MTFGEHLEELRAALVKSMMGLAVGVVFGFVFADNVIDFVETPLLAALDKYYTDMAVHKTTEQYGAELEAEDLALLKESIENDGRVFEDVYFERNELKRLFGIVSETPTLPAGSTAPPDSNLPDSNLPDSNPPDGTDPEATSDAASDATPAATTTAARPAATNEGPGVPNVDLVRTRIWRSRGYKIQAISTTESFLSWMKVGIISGLTIAAPWIFFQLWVFVAEGLYPTEKKYVYIYMPFSLGLFFLGAGIAFFFVFEPVLGFLFSFNETMNSEPVPRISEWLSFFLLLPLGFGIGFQLPLVMLFLNRIGVMSVEAYIKQWRVAVLLIFCAAMLLTPADPQSMLLLAVPLTILYFLGILLCKYLPKRESPFGEGYDPS